MAETMGSVTSAMTANGGVTPVMTGIYDEQVEAKREAPVDGYPLLEKHNEQGNCQGP
ncbi:hypothetical protein PQR75_17645 [Paraburkholderia fungorum]|jgi:hypothetical protein|uniref:hypothetical protein n=1 Tax=Paraburkholderia fungorum TaxID=134537 RepID=UPI0038B9D165